MKPFPFYRAAIKFYSLFQELALYIGFTIAETFRYFGWLTGVPRDELAARTASLLKFLDLPPAHCLIGQLRCATNTRLSTHASLIQTWRQHTGVSERVDDDAGAQKTYKLFGNDIEA